MSRVLVVDDKEMMRDSVATTLTRKGISISAASNAAAALEKLGKGSFDAVVTDLQMPNMTGVELIAEMRDRGDETPVIVMTAYATVETAVDAMKRGAFDYITKPFSGDELVLTVERAIEQSRLVRENEVLRAAAEPIVEEQAPASSNAPASRTARRAPRRPMIGTGPAMHALRQQIGQVADCHGTVLISGESGAGKEVAARAIFEGSPRADQPFLSLNCAALSSSLLESELFGHEKGAFTGADKMRKGRFELADGGTLLLDEISEIPPELQAKLLRVLQEQTFERVGSSTSRVVDVRVLATTNRNLPAEVAAGRFREDLYFRLNVLPVAMPALRDHAEDIPDLVNHFLAEVARREGKPAKQVSPEAMSVLCRYPWPGNVRELQNICERAAVLTRGEEICASLITPWLGAVPVTTGAPARIMSGGPIVEPKPNAIGMPRIVCDGHRTLDDVEREVIVATLTDNDGHRQRSAKALGIGVRTLGLKLKKWKEEQLVASDL